ncbi:hypothetical protein D3C79_1062570 [compost metagenome]
MVIPPNTFIVLILPFLVIHSNRIGIAFSLVAAYDASNDKRKEAEKWEEIINRARTMIQWIFISQS